MSFNGGRRRQQQQRHQHQHPPPTSSAHVLLNSSSSTSHRWWPNYSSSQAEPIHSAQPLHQSTQSHPNQQSVQPAPITPLQTASTSSSYSYELPSLASSFSFLGLRQAPFLAANPDRMLYATVLTCFALVWYERDFSAYLSFCAR
jgi:hypothetical protein